MENIHNIAYSHRNLLGTPAVLDIYRVVVSAGKVNALNCVFALRYDSEFNSILHLVKSNTINKILGPLHSV